MFTRSKAREQRELSEEFVTPYNLSSAMVRKGANSSRGTRQLLKHGKFGDVSLVRLLGMPEVDNN